MSYQKTFRMLLSGLLAASFSACMSPSGGDRVLNDGAGPASPAVEEKPAPRIIGDIGPWRLADFAGSADVRAEDGVIYIQRGNDMTGIVYEGEIPRMNYEIRCEAKRVDGSDFFFGLTFPYGETNCSFIAGGWGGTVIGLSSVNYYDASENQTGEFYGFEKDQWYRIRLQATETNISVWIDDEKMVDLDTDGNHIGLRWEMETCLPLGIATWQTTGAIRGFMIRSLPE